MKPVRLLPLVLLLVATASSQSFAQTAGKARIDDALRAAGQPEDRLQVLVRYKTGASTRVKARLSGKLDWLKSESRNNQMLVVNLRRHQLESVCADPEVASCSQDLVVSSSLPPGGTVTTGISTTTSGGTSVINPLPGTTYDVQNLRTTLGLVAKVNATGGNSVGIAIIDSGIAPVADLSGRIAAFYDFTLGQPGGVSMTPFDLYGHGTHIAALIAGNGSASAGKYVGIANGVRLIGLRVLDANGQGYSSDVINAIDFAIANKAQLGIDILNLSLGHPIYEPPTTDPLVLAVERASAAGIVVVVSAGNYGVNPITGVAGFGGITSPGNARSALTAGALRTKGTAGRGDDEVSPFSSWGPTWYEGRIKPDFLAPGQALVAANPTTSTLYKNLALRADTAGYIKLSGTSMAAAVTSAVVARVIQSNRDDEGASTAPLTPNMVKAILQYTAIPVTSPNNGAPAPLGQGAGAINAAGAVALARSVDPNVALGPWLDAAVIPASTIDGLAYTWSQQIVWGDQVVWGDTVMKNRLAWSQQIVWGDNDQVVWGDSLNILFSSHLVLDSFSIWAYQIVWGDQVVWGDKNQIIWGDIDDQIVWGDMVPAIPKP